MLDSARALRLVQGDWGRRNFNSASANLSWVHSVLKGLADAGRYDLLEDVGAAYCEPVSNWNPFSHNDVLSNLLAELRDRAGDAMARAIHQSGETDYVRRITERQSFTSRAPRNA